MAKAINAAALVGLMLVVTVAAAWTASAITICGVERSAVKECTPYCMAGSTQEAPSKLCCDKVKEADWSCLCKYQDNLPKNIDAKRVMDLANKCKCDYPPATCSNN